MKPPCLTCRRYLTNGREDFCETCQHEIRNLASPRILEVPRRHPTFSTVERNFQTSWRVRKPCPRVLKVSRIVIENSLHELYDDYLRTHGNESFRYHGTERSCQIGDNGCMTLCPSPSCNACCIIRASFDIRLSNPGGA